MPGRDQREVCWTTNGGTFQRQQKRAKRKRPSNSVTTATVVPPRQFPLRASLLPSRHPTSHRRRRTLPAVAHSLQTYNNNQRRRLHPFRLTVLHNRYNHHHNQHCLRSGGACLFLLKHTFVDQHTLSFPPASSAEFSQFPSFARQADPRHARSETPHRPSLCI